MTVCLAADQKPSITVKSTAESIHTHTHTHSSPISQHEMQMWNPLPSVIFIPLKICLGHCISLTLQHSSLARCYSNISALWHSWSIYKEEATHESTAVRTTRQLKSRMSGEGSRHLLLFRGFWFIAVICCTPRHTSKQELEFNIYYNGERVKKLRFPIVFNKLTK